MRHDVAANWLSIFQTLLGEEHSAMLWFFIQQLCNLVIIKIPVITSTCVAFECIKPTI